MLVPEIALTPPVAALFRARFGAGVAIQHSGLSDGERHDQWHRIRRGDVDVVIGTRSAVFAPLARPGTDHRRRGARHVVQAGGDAALSRPRRRGHARQVRRARWSCSDRRRRRWSRTSTRSQQRYTLVTLTRRVLDRPLAARRRVVNMREEIADEGDDVVLSRPLREAMRERLERGEQVARPAEPPRLRDRGVLPAVRRHDRLSELQRLADGAHASRASDWRARCHYCNFSRSCRRRARSARRRTWSTSASAPSVSRRRCARLFPAARVGRVDRDTMRRQGQPRRAARPVGEPRARRPGRHADDREGPRLSAGDAGRRDLGRRRPRAWRTSAPRSARFSC